MLLEPGRLSMPNVLPVVENGMYFWTLGASVAMEMLIGILIGFGASLPILGMQVGGRIIDQQMGLGIAGVFNPEVGEETGVISEFFFILSLTIFILIGGLGVVLTTLIGSFNHIPLGSFMVDGNVIDLLLGLCVSMFDLGMRVAAPLLCLFFLLTISMGFIARTVPQLNILSIGFTVRIVCGALIVIGAMGVMFNVFDVDLHILLRRISVFFAP
jgi:flagellar biosynthetic protein FliR